MNIPVLAGVCNSIRALPGWWFWIDFAFAPGAALPLWIAYSDIRAIEQQGKTEYAEPPTGADAARRGATQSKHCCMNMELTTTQRLLLQSMIHNIFVEIPGLCKDPVALSDLAYAAHNLSKWERLSDGDRDHIRRLFRNYHHKHGYHIFDFIAMLMALDGNTDPGPEAFLRATSCTSEQPGSE